MKVHLIINHRGEVISFYISSGNVSDNNKKVLLDMTKGIVGKVFGDKGYIVNSKLFKELFQNGVQMITKIRSNMKNKLMDLFNKALLKKRGVIESSIGIMKNGLNIEHTRHRSIWAFFLSKQCEKFRFLAK